MDLKILAFGISKDIVGNSSLDFALEEGNTVQDLKLALIQQYPDFEKLVSLLIAVNSEYAADDQVLSERDEIAIIPPVSGG